MSDPIRYITAVKDGHHYLFRYTPGYEHIVIKSILDYAKNEECNLDYRDVVSLVKHLRDSLLEGVVISGIEPYNGWGEFIIDTGKGVK